MNGTDSVDLDRVRSRTSSPAPETLLVETDHTGSVVSTVRRTVLPGGLRVVTARPMPIPVQAVRRGWANGLARQRTTNGAVTAWVPPGP